MQLPSEEGRRRRHLTDISCTALTSRWDAGAPSWGWPWAPAPQGRAGGCRASVLGLGGREIEETVARKKDGGFHIMCLQDL